MRVIFIMAIALSMMALAACATRPSTTAPQEGEAPIPEQAILPEPNTSPAVVSLVKRARVAARDGDLQRAESLLERSVRIEPRNATLWNYLARLRLEQGRLNEAQGLAAKSNALAGDNHRLAADNWRIIAHARYQNGDVAGAKQAQARANQLFQTDEP
jgi:predicted Zn-dependent protease